MPETPHPDGFTGDNAELAMCVQMNLATLAQMAPAVARHPIFLIAKDQLDALVKRLEEAD